MKPIKLIFYLICLNCSIFQVYDMTSQYFKYLTATVSTVEVPEYSKMPDLSYCIRLTNIFNQKKFTRNKGYNVFNQNQNSVQKLNLMTQKMTVNDMFKYTPDDVIVNCAIHTPGRYELNNKSTCNENFQIYKYIV